MNKLLQTGSATASPLGGSNTTMCDFEQQTICGFTQVPSPTDKFDWSWDAQGTSTSGTGPSVDHTKGTSLGSVIVCLMFNLLSVIDKATVKGIHSCTFALKI